MRLADYVFDYLAGQGARHVFLVTGRGALFLSDAVEKHQALTPVCTHHEQGAAFAAIAYAEAADHPAVCLTSTGCASTNALTGVLSAWQDGIPVYFISGQNTLAETTRHTGEPIRTYGQQEADIIALVSSITKHAAFISDPARIRFELEKATFLAHEGRPGPVWIDIPLDVQNRRVDPTELDGFAPEKTLKTACAEEDVEIIAHKLARASRPVVLIGGGIKLDGAAGKLKTFVERNKLPVVYTSAAPDAYGSTHANSIGSVGVMGCSRAGAFAVQNADFLLALGSRLPSSVVGSDPAKFAREADIIAVDENVAEFARYRERLFKIVAARPAAVLDALQPLELQKDPAWLDKCRHWKTAFARYDTWQDEGPAVDLHNFAAILSNALPDSANFICDSGFVDVILPTNMRFSGGQNCIHPVYQGAMGFAVPGAVGAYLANGKPTVAVVGDGSVMMNLQEFQTIVHHQLPVKIIVVNNGIYAIIKRRQVELFRKRTIGTDTSNGVSVPEFSAMAAGFGLRYEQLTEPDKMDADLKQLLAAPEPMMIEIFGRPDQIYLEVAFAKTRERKFVKRPLEDQAPFMDRELFTQEMIIPVIDQ